MDRRVLPGDPHSAWGGSRAGQGVMHRCYYGFGLVKGFLGGLLGLGTSVAGALGSWLSTSALHVALSRCRGGGRAAWGCWSIASSAWEPRTKGVTVGWMCRDVQKSEQCHGARGSDAYSACVQATPAVCRLTVSLLSSTIPGAGVEQSLGKDLGSAIAGGRHSPSSGHSLKPVPRAPCIRAGVAPGLGAALVDVGDALRRGDAMLQELARSSLPGVVQQHHHRWGC